MLDKAVFADIIHHTPLVSLDLLVENAKGEYLLGLRTNRPARGFWFVPGGRVFKNETLAAAFERLTLSELGVTIAMQQATHHGLYEHFYNDNVFGDEGPYAQISTHYIVNAFKIRLPHLAEPPFHQHSDYRWLTPAQLLAERTVHEHTKWYFE
ncbi:GDP-mannose mannosyl hydrolase [Achromobacter sp. F4_2707]|uniref:GDP-mannose mannosyl hydrolase n=1 Tax=Achromobacter sp. F4_2707 TaxID=3114286 RepID=UPI0039C6F382